jgi:hypothetical protein
MCTNLSTSKFNCFTTSLSLGSVYTCAICMQIASECNFVCADTQSHIKLHMKLLSELHVGRLYLQSPERIRVRYAAHTISHTIQIGAHLKN